MDNLILEYRDPLFGIIILVGLIFLISFFTYMFNLYKERDARKDYRKLLKRFELGKLKEEDYVHLYKTYNLPFDSILLLASSFLHKGSYNKAINVYLTLLEHVKDRVKKEELLELLGKTYYKGGFLIRSKDIFLRILKFSPRNIEALNYLLYVCEKLKDFKKAKEVISCLEELKIDVEKDKIFLETQLIINNSIMPNDKKIELLYKIFKEDKTIQRNFASFLLQVNKEKFWDLIDEFDFTLLCDIMWYFPKDEIDFEKIKNNNYLVELYSAKNYINESKSSSIFNFDILIMLKENRDYQDIYLDFEYLCKTCKQTNAIYENRCPNCHSILSYDIKHSITKGYYEANQSLQ